MTTHRRGAARLLDRAAPSRRDPARLAWRNFQRPARTFEEAKDLAVRLGDEIVSDDIAIDAHGSAVALDDKELNLACARAGLRFEKSGSAADRSEFIGVWTAVVHRLVRIGREAE
jgi:hypothetical protein